MILSIAGLAGGADVSSALDRTTFEVEASVGKRMDTTRFTLFDPTLIYGIPDRAELWIYDAAPGSAVTDPPNAVSAYNTFLNGAGHEITSTSPGAWTPRLFAGYCADVAYQVLGAQRLVDVTAQDYTVRLRTTIGNFAFAQGQTDQSIIQTLFGKYWPEIDVSNVNQVASGFPAISFPIHTLEQVMERVVRVSRAIYRVDYFKRLFYGALGQQSAPFNLSDTPDGNLLPNPSFEPNLAGWNLYNNGPESASLSLITDGTAFDALSFARVTWSVANTSTKGLNLSTGQVRWAPNTTYVVSFYARGTGGAVGTTMNLYWNTGPATQVAVSNPAISGSWQRYVFRITWGATVDPNLFLSILNAGSQAAGSLDIDAVKIEQGPNVTPFTTGLTSFGYERMKYSPYGSGLANKVWIVGSSYLSKVQTYQVPPATVNGTSWQFALPGNPELTGLSVKVNAVDQGTVGVTPGDGDIGSQSGWRAGVNVLIQHTPAIVALKTTPPNGATILVTGQFRYPLVSAVSDPASIQATGGKVFEAVIRDRRVADLTLAQQVGQAFLKNQGVTLKGGSCTIKRRLIGSALIQPGQQIQVTGVRLFTGLLAGGLTTFTALITKLSMRLTDDVVEPYEVGVEFADRQVGMTS